MNHPVEISDGPGPVAVIGGGAWGSALADHLARRAGCTVRQFVRRPALRAQLQDTRACPTLPGFALDPKIEYPATLAETLSGASLIVLAIPSGAVAALAKEMAPQLSPGALVVSAVKGLLPDGRRLSEALTAMLPAANPVAVLSGPSFARGLIAGDPTAVVTAAQDAAIATQLQQAVTAGNLRAYAATDMIGVELGGAVKNVLAIAAGAVEGLGLGPNAQAALITRGLKEMSDLVIALGGRFETCMGLSGLGDLVLTATGSESRNRLVGRRLGAGEPLEKILHSLGEVAEGVETARSLVALADRHGVEMPICRAVHATLHGGVTPREAIETLLRRPLKTEASQP